MSKYDCTTLIPSLARNAEEASNLIFQPALFVIIKARKG